jgi:hypothetical protein
MSAGWWRVQHNKHHSMPQKLGYDVDLDTLPLVAFTEKVGDSDSLRPTSPQAFLVSPLLATSTIATTTAITISILLSPVVHTNTSNSSTININSVESSLPLPPLLTCAFTTFTTALQIFC